MKNPILLLLLLLLSGNCFSQNENSDPKSESKATFVLIINNTEYTLAEGETLKLDSTFKQPTISIQLAENLTFDNGGISFSYPKNFSFEFEEDLGYQNWTLDGNNFVIMYFVLDEVAELDAFVDEMVAQFGKSNCKIEKSQKTLGSKTLTGKRINVTLVGQNLSIDFLQIKLSDGKSRFIAFQDMKNEDGSASEESVKAFEMLNKTIRYD